MSHINQFNIRDYVPRSTHDANNQTFTFYAADPILNDPSLQDDVSAEMQDESRVNSRTRWAGLTLLAVLSVFTVHKFYPDSFKSTPQLMSYYVEPVVQPSPAFVAFDLSGHGLATVDKDQSKVFLDVHNQGMKHKIGWLGSDTGLLFHDANNNQRMDGMSELITLDYDQAQDVKGFHMLRKFDGNKDGRVDRLDKEFSDLYIWKDHAVDGIFETHEAHKLWELGITGLQLKASHYDDADEKTSASQAKLLSKGRYAHDPNRVKGHLRDTSGGDMFMVSFATDLTRYKTADGAIVTAALPEKVQTIKLAQNLIASAQAPSLRGTLLPK